MAQNNELNAALVRIGIPAVAGAGTVTLPGPWLKRGSRLKMLTLLSIANITADAANYITMQLQDLAGNVLLQLTTKPADGGGVNLGAATALTPLNSGVDADLDTAIGLATKLVVTSTGTATIAANSHAQVDYHNR